MTWQITPPADRDEADARVHAVGEFAVVAIDTLQAAAGVLAMSSEVTMEEARLRGSQLEQLRDELVELFKIHKARLPRETVEDLREGFRLAEIHDAADRKTLADQFFNRDVGSLWELSTEEAALLRARLIELEPSF